MPTAYIVGTLPPFFPLLKGGGGGGGWTLKNLSLLRGTKFIC